MKRTSIAVWASLLMLGTASLILPAAAQSDPGGMMGGGRAMGHDDGSEGMMGGGMGRGGMMENGGMRGRDMGDCCAGMMGKGGMMGGMGHPQRPNQQWRHSAPAPDQG